MLGEMLRFGMVGVANTLVGLGAIYLFMAMGFGLAPANALGFAVGLVCSFWLNNSWTFTADRSVSWAKVGRFAAAFLIAYAANLAAVLLAHGYFHMPGHVAQLIGQPVYTLIFFLLARSFVFRGRGPTETPHFPSAKA